MNINYLSRTVIYIFLPSMLWMACDTSDEPDLPPVNKYLVSLEEVEKVASWQAQAAASFLDFKELDKYIISDAIVYRMIYNTSYKGEPVQASGLIGIPSDHTLGMAIASLHHGTSIEKSDSPSTSPDDYYFLSAMSVTGMITLIPDFLGFGASEQLLHPYYVQEGEAVPVVDMIHAAVELMEDSAYTWNDKLYLTGYSEGGYVTMATHKYIQEHPEEGLTVTASAPAAGGYDLMHMKNYFTAQEIYKQPYYIAYVVSAYKSWYKWTDPFTTFFQEPYASRIPTLFDGSIGGGQINKQLTRQIKDYLQPDMINSFDTDEKYTVFKQALKDNSLLDWTPMAPVRMTHGTADITVPYSNSVATFEALKENGAGDNLQLIPIEGADHASGLTPMIKDAVIWILEMD